MLKNKVKYLELNKYGIDYAVGDIHGCYNEFKKMLSLINFDTTKDRMLSVGDVIDRGEDSLKCLELIMEPWFHMVLANHEDMMVRSIIQNDANQLDSWLYNGGQWYHKVNNEDPLLLKTLSEYIVEHVPYVMVVDTPSGRVNIVHAEILHNIDQDLATDPDIDNWNFSDINEDIMCWGRKICENRHYFKTIKNRYLSTTYCGHTPVDKPFECLNHRFIDTGAVFATIKELDRNLTMVDITNNLVYSYNIKSGTLSKESCKSIFK